MYIQYNVKCCIFTHPYSTYHKVPQRLFGVERLQGTFELKEYNDVSTSSQLLQDTSWDLPAAIVCLHLPKLRSDFSGRARDGCSLQMNL